jgi:Putative metallopeptidase
MKSTYRLFAVLFVTICLSLLVIPVKLAVADAQSKRISVDEPPKNPAHQRLYEMLTEHRVLEKMQEIFSPYQLPIELIFKTVGCDGVSNAWYSRPTVTICYEYLAEIQRDMPKETTPAGVTPVDAVLGQFFYAIAHEAGHAMFDLLSVPIFGYQEDAADQFAGYIILHFGKADARRLILGAAHSYKKYV